MKRMSIITALAAALLTSPAFAEVERVDAGNDTNPGGGAQDYLDKVAKRRARFGNEDGLKQSSLVAGSQVTFGLGFNTYTAAGLDQFDGPHFSLSMVNTFNDNVGWELWGGYATGSVDTTILGVTTSNSIDKVDVGIMARFQGVVPMGGGDSFFIPHAGLGPVYSNISAAGNSSASSIGMGAQVGADMQMGGMVIGAKFKYVFSRDVSDTFVNKDTSYMIPSLSVGWAF